MANEPLKRFVPPDWLKSVDWKGQRERASFNEFEGLVSRAEGEEVAIPTELARDVLDILRERLFPPKKKRGVKPKPRGLLLDPERDMDERVIAWARHRYRELQDGGMKADDAKVKAAKEAKEKFATKRSVAWIEDQLTRRTPLRRRHRKKQRP